MAARAPRTLKAEPAERSGWPQRSRVELVPRMRSQGYTNTDLARRRAWLEEKTGSSLNAVGATAIDGQSMRGNVENAVGAVQMPLGVAGPLRLDGEHAKGIFYVPLATTEGALVRSYERGMIALTRVGGARTRIWLDENRVSPVFSLSDVGAALEFSRLVGRSFEELRREAESTTRHGRLLDVECFPVGRKVVVNFRFDTADAHGMNMIVKAADAACRWLERRGGTRGYQIFSGYSSEKRASGSLLAGGKGKKVTAGALLPRAMVQLYLGTTPDRLAELWQLTVMGHLQANAVGYNGHYANGLTALYIACGQDVANVANSAVGITTFEVTPDGDLYAAVTLPSISVATVGGGTALGTSRECLEMLGCFGSGKARKLAEIVAGTVLAGEISMGAAIASGEFVNAHETYGRNRPGPAETSSEQGETAS